MQPVLRTATILAALTVVTTFGAHAQEVKTLRGKPSSAMILEALGPVDAPEAAPLAAPAVAPEGAPAAPVRRRRGLALIEDEGAEPAAPAGASVAAVAAAATAAAAVQAQPAPAPAPAPVAAHAAPQPSAPSAQVAYRPQMRALDLEIQFRFGSDELTNDGKDVLDQLAAALKSERLAAARTIVLEGHADARGSAAFNEKLSLKRAQSARNYLVGRHEIEAAKMIAVGKGSSEPADPNNPESEVNRRVRVILEI